MKSLVETLVGLGILVVLFGGSYLFAVLIVGLDYSFAKMINLTLIIAMGAVVAAVLSWIVGNTIMGFRK